MRRPSALRAVVLILAALSCRRPPAAPTPHVIAEPELVGPGVLSTAREETFPAIDPVDGSLWFSSYEGENWNRQTVMRAPRAGDGWGPPAPVRFDGADTWGARAPRFSPDGRRVYFSSNRPVDGAPGRSMNLWVMDRPPNGSPNGPPNAWGPPRALPSPVNTPAQEYHAAETAAGDLYFASTRPGGFGRSDIYRVPRAGDGWGPVEHLPAPVNDARSQPDLLVAPDGTWMVLVVTNPPADSAAGEGEDDLFVSRFAGGRWGTPERLPAPINSPAYEYGPSLSPDGRTLYFTSQRRGSADIYRVPLAALGLARP